MLNICVISASHDMVTDTGRATTCRRKSKASSLQKSTKVNALPKTWVSAKNRLKISEEKNNKNITFDLYETIQ